MVNEKRGLPSFFMTGSCGEFYCPPLRRLLEQYILQTMGEEVNLAEDSNARFKAGQENTHVVVSYFDLCTQSYHVKVLKPVFGVSDYWYRYEFAKSRGEIHWHQLSWRDDRQPHHHAMSGLQPRERVCRMECGSEFCPGKKLRNYPEIVGDHNGAPRLEIPRDHPCVVQHSRCQIQSWRGNGDVSLILSNSPPDNPSTDDIIAIIDHVCGYACKDSETTGATADLFNDMVNAVDATDADQVMGKSMCAKMLIKTVGRRDISGPESSFELSVLALWRCSRSFTYLSMSGSR